MAGDTFEKCLHRYLIKDAIADKNVLGSNVDYYSKKYIDESNDEKMKIRKYANVGRVKKKQDISKHVKNSNINRQFPDGKLLWNIKTVNVSRRDVPKLESTQRSN